jgi:hypothetical protein
MMSIKNTIQTIYLFILALIDFFIFKELYSNSIIDYTITFFLIINTVLIFVITKDEVFSYFNSFLNINKDLDEDN